LKKLRVIMIFAVFLVFVIGIVAGVTLSVFYGHVVNVYEEKCGLYGWEFYSFFPEPTCNVFDNKFPLSRLEVMYPNATPFPELPPAKTQEPGEDF
jgi:hypothetical protein